MDRSVRSQDSNGRLESGGVRRPRSDRDQRQRQRSVSPQRSIDSDGDERKRRGHGKKQNRPQRRRQHKRRVSGNVGETMDWARNSRSPAPRRAVQGRRAPQSGAPEDDTPDPFDDLAAKHRDALPPLKSSTTEPAQNIGNNNNNNNNMFKELLPTMKRNSKAVAASNNNDIDAVIAQFRDQCDMHLGALLELKNNITASEKEAVVSSEKDKEFQQVRQWYSSLAEKHTKLQKEHQALQEDHVKLQERYMTLKRASNLDNSFIANLEKAVKEKKEKKKDKKGKLDVVWSRAGKIGNKIQQQLQ